MNVEAELANKLVNKIVGRRVVDSIVQQTIGRQLAQFFESGIAVHLEFARLNISDARCSLMCAARKRSLPAV